MKQIIFFQCVKLEYLKQDPTMFQTIQYKFNKFKSSSIYELHALTFHESNKLARKLRINGG